MSRLTQIETNRRPKPSWASWRRRAAVRPTSQAIGAPGRAHLTYEALLGQVRDTAAALALAGCGRGHRVAPRRLRHLALDERAFAFGRGRHSCVGGSLVALEMGAALVALMQETSEVRLATDAVRFVPRPGTPLVERLPVRWRASRPRRHAE